MTKMTKAQLEAENKALKEENQKLKSLGGLVRRVHMEGEFIPYPLPAVVESAALDWASHKAPALHGEGDVVEEHDGWQVWEVAVKDWNGDLDPSCQSWFLIRYDYDQETGTSNHRVSALVKI